MDKDLVKVYFEENGTNATITKGFLESNGITNVKLEPLATKNSGLRGGMPDISKQCFNVWVPREQAQKAKELLEERDKNFHVDTFVEENIKEEKSRVVTFFSVLVFFIALFLIGVVVFVILNSLGKI